MAVKQYTLTTSQTLTITASGPTQVEVSSVSGKTVTLTSSTGLVAERTITANTIFKSEMEDMLFTMTTGTGAVIGLTPMTNDQGSQQRIFKVVQA